ncbi:hypothetical protein [Ancylobacter radicis]|uniref:Uncharacterized protein n=1 Tax=Ancylobacter radicis TaxID=2836179 RepID=A0ABS5R3N5_9HYPH|nr:hypothetical protein [Ancylobacter radicis]MBS9476265.1 hypothetical protein [Ancylobacter radicis]
MIIADQHKPHPAKPGDTRETKADTEKAAAGKVSNDKARSAMPHAGETIGEESNPPADKHDK